MSSQKQQPKQQQQPTNGTRLNFRKNLRPVVEYYWSDVDPGMIVEAIDAVTREGAAIMFGRTSDGGAFSLLILHGNEKAKEYPHTVEECQDLLRDIKNEFHENSIA